MRARGVIIWRHPPQYFSSFMARPFSGHTCAMTAASHRSPLSQVVGGQGRPDDWSSSGRPACIPARPELVISSDEAAAVGDRRNSGGLAPISFWGRPGRLSPGLRRRPPARYGGLVVEALGAVSFLFLVFRRLCWPIGHLNLPVLQHIATFRGGSEHTATSPRFDFGTRRQRWSGSTGRRDTRNCGVC